MKTAQFILATDLDGTFLGGSDTERRTLYEWIEANRADVSLIFVSGRDLPHIEMLCGDAGVPWPDYVIGDVGTTIARVENEPDTAGHRVFPIPELERDIAATWADSGANVRAALEGASGLTLQPTPFRYRVSYDYDPAHFDPAATERIEELGFDTLISDDRFFDVLPRGISKGPSLLRLIRDLEIQSDRVLVAGDTMNDLSLFETDLHGVAVGNSEDKLVARLQHRDSVYFAKNHGSGGIAEAISHFNLYSGKRPAFDV